MEEQRVSPGIAPFIQLNKNNVIPQRVIVGDDGSMGEFSDDVITVDSEGMMCIAYYHFGDEKWYFHSDTLYEGYENDFTWMHKPTGFHNWK